MGKVLLPATAAMDEVAAALGEPVVRYASVHDAVARLRGGDVACVVVDAGDAEPAAAGVIGRFREVSDAAVVVAVGPTDDPATAAVDAAAVVDRTAPAAAARRLAELRTEAALERANARSAGAEALLREATEAVASAETTRLDSLGDLVVASLGGTRPYPVAWLGQYDPERQTVQPLTAAGTPTAHLRAVPVSDVADWTAANASVTAEAVAADEGAAVFAEQLEDHGRAAALGDGPRLLALRIPTAPVAVLHLVADRPGGVPGTERSALIELGEALAAAVADDTPVGEDGQLRLLADALAHELRNQVGAANLQLELAEAHGDAEHFEHVSRALDRLEGLSEETRALARAEPDREEVTLREVAESAWNALAAPDATLRVEDATLEVDAALLRLAMVNLLRNAVEHGSTSPAPGAQRDTGDHDSTSNRPAASDAGNSESAALHVEVGPLGDGEGFFVADDGWGIPPGEREQVLEWGHASGDGTGVGLGLVRIVAERHSWTVSVGESEAGGARIELGPDA